MERLLLSAIIGYMDRMKGCWKCLFRKKQYLYSPCSCYAAACCTVSGGDAWQIFLYECAARVPVFVILAHTDAVWRGMLLFLAGSVLYLFLFEGLKIRDKLEDT